MSLMPGYNLNNIFRKIESFADSKLEKAINTLYYVGETFVNSAREKGTYKDRTGNLRHSISCVVLYDGKIQKQKIVTGDRKDENGRGNQRAREMIDEMARKYSKGLVLICMAGMNYAAAVESKGYDVISGSVPLAGDLLKELKQGLGVV